MDIFTTGLIATGSVATTLIVLHYVEVKGVTINHQALTITAEILKFAGIGYVISLLLRFI